MLRPHSMFLASLSLVAACRIAGEPTIVSDATTPTVTSQRVSPLGVTVAASDKQADSANGKVASTTITPIEDHRAEWRAFLASARRTQIDRIRAYRLAGQFPVNRVRPGRLNVFVDDRTGALCAVANLIAQSGHRDLVDQTAAANNFVRVADMTSGPVLDWLLTSGLTKEEAVFIQEPYSFQPGDEPTSEPVALAPNGDLPVAVASPAVIEKQRLRRHFVAVERRLEADFEASLDVAMSRLPAARLAHAPSA